MEAGNIVQHTFTLLKPEAYILDKVELIEQRLNESGLTEIGRYQVTLNFKDVFSMYPGWQARVATLARLPPLFVQDVICFKGPGAVTKLNTLKYKIRKEIWGFEYKKGGYLHVPDTLEEVALHNSILAKRVVGRRRYLNVELLNS